MGVQVAAIGSGSVDQLIDFVATVKPTFPVYADPRRNAFKAYGLKDASIASLANPAVIKAGLAAARQGYAQGKTAGAARQLPGTAIVSPDGIIRFYHAASHAGDHAPVADLLAALADPGPG